MRSYQRLHRNTRHISERYLHRVSLLPLIAEIWRRVRRRRRRAEGFQWTASMLKDLGLSESDLFSLLAGTLSKDPTRRKR